MSRIPRTFRPAAFLLALAGLTLAVDRAAAQQQASNLPLPRLMTVMPSGGKVGTTVEVSFTGTDLEEPDSLVFSHPGIKAEPVMPADPSKPDPKQPPKPNAKPVVTKFKVTIAANVPVGFHDVRLVNKWGVSNPRVFVVGDLDEVVEQEPNNDLPQSQKVTLNSTVNGSMAAPTDVDYFVFPAKKGQRLLISCLASSIDSRFHPSLQVFDARNRMLGENRNYKDHDALVDCTAPEDGDLYVRVTQFTHTAGTAEYFYRLSISTGPWIDAVYPPVVEAGKTAQVTVYGRNLPGGQPDPTAEVEGVILEKMTMSVTAPADPTTINFLGQISPLAAGLDGFELRVKNGNLSSNPFLMMTGRAPVVLEAASNDTMETAQEIKVPCELAGRVEKRRDKDWYSFTAKKGDVLVFDLFGDRLGVDSDMYFGIRSGDGKQIITDQEDNADMMSTKFYARTDDPPPYRFVAPADGKYLLVIGSRTSGHLFGARHVYRMKITPEEPDFRVVTLGPDSYRPCTCTILKGGSEQMTVFAWRNDGFNGDIELTVEGLPKGVTCPPQRLGGGLRHTQLVFTAASDAADWTGEIKVKATATIGGKKVVREVRPAGIVWPVQVGQNFPRVSRLERGLALAVRGQAPFSLVASVDNAKVPQGSPAVITLKLNRVWADFKQPLQITASIPQGTQAPPSLPAGLQPPAANIAPTANEAKVTLNIGTGIAPGTYNLVFRGTAQIPYNKDPMSKTKQPTPVVLPSTPVSLTILPKSVANLQLSAPNVNAKVGTNAEVIVRVQRQFNFDGEFKVELVLPPGTQGLGAVTAVTIPAGQNEVKMVIPVSANATPGNRANLTVKATAMFETTPVVHETKLNINVTK